MSLAPNDTVPDATSHPEEIKSVFDMRVGKHITIHATARITPAGVISTGIALAAMTLAMGYVAGSLRFRR